MATAAEDVTVKLAGGELQDIRMGVMTWNMGNASPGEDWVTTAFPEGGKDFDLIAIGMQESTYQMSAIETAQSAEVNPGVKQRRGSQIVDVAIGACIGALFATIERSLPDFQIVKHCHRVQMQLYVLVRKPLFEHVDNVEFAIENTGFMHLFPNKGGLLLCFTLFGTRLAFLSCHLTAHEGVKNCEMRNNSIKEILGGVRVVDTRFDISGQAHHMFWMGDMNYRLTSDPAVPKSSPRNEEMTKEQQTQIRSDYDMEEDEHGEEVEIDDPDRDSKDAKKAANQAHREKVTKLLLANDWQALLDLDELNREIRDNRALKGFTALQPSFPPTFKRKRHVGIDNPKTIMQGFNTDEEKAAHFADLYDHKRCPSFTDRILHRSMPHFERNLVSKTFISFENLTTSDHKPVRGEFSLKLTKGSKDILVSKAVQEHLDSNNISKIIQSKRGIEIVISKMKAKNLAEMDVRIAGMGGLSDPYIVVTSDPTNLIATNKVIQSSIVKHNINPEWPLDETIRVPLVTNDLEGLSRNGHLLLSVWDYDFSNDDDLIGLCRIPMDTIVKAFRAGKPLALNEMVYENGEIQGQILGEIHVTGMVDKVMTAFEADKNNMTTLSEIVVPEEHTLLGCCTIA